MHSYEKYIPEKIWNYEPFVEGDYIVYAAVNRIIIRRDYKSLKGIEKYAVYRPESKQFKMLVFDGVQLAQFEFAVINARFHSPTSFEMMLRLTDGFRFAFRAGHFDFALALRDTENISAVFASEIFVGLSVLPYLLYEAYSALEISFYFLIFIKLEASFVEIF